MQKCPEHSHTNVSDIIFIVDYYLIASVLFINKRGIVTKILGSHYGLDILL